MRVESCGPIFVEPKEGDVLFSRHHHRLSEPITRFLNPKTSLFGEKDEDLIGEIADSGREASGHQLPLGFFFNEEEWSLFRQPAIDLKSLDEGTMDSFSKSPFALRSPLFPNRDPHPDSGGEHQSGEETVFFEKEIEQNNNFPHQLDSGDWNRLENLDDQIDSAQLITSNLQEDRALQREVPFVMEDTFHSGQGQSGHVRPELHLPWNYGPRMIPPVDTIASHATPITVASTCQGHFHPPNQCYGYGQPPQTQTRFGWGDQVGNEMYQKYQPQKQRSNWQSTLQHWGGEGDEAAEEEWDGNANKIMVHPLKSMGKEKQDPLKSFLSKFDNKVAAIWGSQQDPPLDQITVSESENADSYISSSSTPVSHGMYPWTSPKVEEMQNKGERYYDFRAVQSYIDQQQLEELEGFVDPYGVRRRQRQIEAEQIKRPTPTRHRQEDPAVIAPPTKNDLQKTIKQTFGNAPPIEDYFLFTPQSSEESEEMLETSLKAIEHSDVSGFVRFIPQFSNKRNEPCQMSGQEGKSKAEEGEIKNMEKLMQELFLNGSNDEYPEAEDELDREVASILKLNPKTYCEQQQSLPAVELWQNWISHFTPIQAITNNPAYKSQSKNPPPIPLKQDTTPEYIPRYLGHESEYRTFNRPGAQTLFPIRFKLRQQNDKATQTNERDLDDAFSHLTVFDWDNYWATNNPCSSEQEVQQYSLSSGSVSITLTPVKSTLLESLENNPTNVFDYMTGDWYPGEPTYGAEMERYDQELDAFRTNVNMLGGATGGYPEYACDSGIGIDGSSRAGFYEDQYAEYEYENYGEAVEDPTGAMAMVGYADYGQFQAFSAFQNWSSSSNSGKSGRRKGKPCKYFMSEGSCRRGRNCKFSHDLVTCRYWAEGACLKGDDCPYLHCFLSEIQLEENGNRGASQLPSRYHLDSENDFPTLDPLCQGAASGMVDEERTVTDGGYEFQENAGSSVDSHFVLADPAGFVSNNWGFGTDDCLEYDNPVSFPSTGNMNPRKQATVPSWPRTSAAGKGRNNNPPSNNNNWITSMISVKEKKKKRKSKK